MDRRPATTPVRLSSGVAVASLVTGAAAAVLVPESRIGLGLALVAVAAIVVGAVATRPRSPWQWFALVAAGLLAASPALRDASWLVAGNLVIAAFVAAGALAGAPDLGRMAAAGSRLLAQVPLAPVVAARAIALPGSLRRGEGLAALRGLALAAVLVTVFGALFVSADGAFAHLVGRLTPDTGLAEMLPGRIAVALAACAVAGALGMAGAPMSPRAAGVPGRVLSPREWVPALGALVALFCGFVGVQFVVLFGGHDHVLDTAGLTYAEYAREGFGQLLVVAVLALVIVLGSWRWAAAGTSTLDLARRTLGAALCLLTLVIVAAALHRLDLYAEAFGATRMRAIAATICLWIGGLLLLTGIAAVRGSRLWLPRAGLLLSAGLAVAFTAVNPDARIAETNVERYERLGRIDVAYNSRLSADAAPELGSLPASVAARVLAGQRRRLEGGDGLGGLNLARERARDAVASLDAP